MKAKNPFVPLLPPGSPLARPHAQRRSHVQAVFFVVAGVSVFALMVMLIKGCIHSNRITEIANTAHPAVAARSPMAASNSVSHAALVSPSQPMSRPNATPVAQQSVLPGTSASAGKDYSVVKGDNYYKIAKANGISVGALAKANPGVEPTKLRIGQVLCIPVASENRALPHTTVTHVSAKGTVVGHE